MAVFLLNLNAKKNTYVSKKTAEMRDFLIIPLYIYLYWQENLVTYEPYGMNKKTEIEKARQKMKHRFKKKRTVRSWRM